MNMQPVMVAQVPIIQPCSDLMMLTLPLEVQSMQRKLLSVAMMRNLSPMGGVLLMRAGIIRIVR